MGSKKTASSKHQTTQKSTSLKTTKVDKNPASTPATHSNALLLVANPLFNLASQVKVENPYKTIKTLQQHILTELNDFEKTTRSYHYDAETLFMSRYVLTIFLNEMINKTEWAKAETEQNILLAGLKSEDNPDERFFVILDKLCQHPSQFIDLIELMYICLSLGFQGKFKADFDDMAQLQTITNLTYQIIQNYRGEIEKRLSPTIDNARPKNLSYKTRFPIGKIALVTSFIILLTFLLFDGLLTLSTTPVLKQAQTIIAEPL